MRCPMNPIDDGLAVHFHPHQNCLNKKKERERGREREKRKQLVIGAKRRHYMNLTGVINNNNKIYEM